MATEIDIPVSVSSKKGEREDDAFSSEFSEGKVAEHPGNKVKQLESGPNQPLETSIHVAETVNTQLESDKRIDEGGTFFQALSVPVVTADEHINTPESCETTTTEDQEDRWTAKIETVTEGKPNDDERVAVIASKDTEDHNVVEAISAQTKGSTDHVLGLIKDSDIYKEEVTEFSNKEIEYNVVPTDVCISTQTEPEEKTPENEEKNEEDVSGSDDSLTVKELCEEVVSKKVESEEVSNLPDNSSMVLNENAIVSKEDQDKLQVSGKGQGGGDDVTSSQNASSEYIKETKTGQHATTPAYFKEGQELNGTPKDILEKGDDKTIDPQEESEQCKNEAKDKREQKQEESVNKIVPSSLEIEQEVETEEIKPSDEKQEQQGLLHVITADASNSTQTKSHVESEENNEEETIESDDGQTKKLTTQSKPEEETTEENEEKSDEEANECDDGQTKKSRSPMVEVCKETVPENANEYEEGLIHSDTSSMVLNENEIVSKDEYQEKGQEFYVSEKGQHGGDDVTSSQNASSEDIKEMIGEHDTKVAYFEEVQGLNAVAKDILKEDAIVPQEVNEQYENGAHDKKEQKPEESIHSCLEIEQEECAKEIKPDVEKELKEEQEGQMHISTQTETQVESRLEATEHEEKNEHKENEQEVGMLEENQGEEEASSKRDLEGKNYDGEHIELELVENGESIKEDIEAIRTNVETEEIKEQGSLSAIVTDVCKSAPIESKEDTTKSEESIESHDSQKEKLVIPGVNEGCEETGLNFVESIEEVQPFDSSTMKQNDKDQEVNMSAKGQGNDNVTSSQDAASEEDLQEKDCHKGDDESEFVKTRQTIEKDIEEIGLNENEVANTDEDQEKEQELKMSEEVQGGGDDVISSQNEKNEDIIETTINQESQCEPNKEIESKLDAENQANGREDRSEKNDEVVLTEKMSSELGQPKEQNVEEIQACQTTAMSEKIEDQIAEKDDDLSLGRKKDTDDDTIKEEKNFLDGKTREIETSTLENEPVGEKTTIKLEEITKKDFQESQTETNVEIEGKLDAENQADVRKDRSEIKDEVIVTEKMSSELGQLEQNVEEIQECQTTTMSKKIEDEIAEKDEDLSLGSKEGTDDDTIKEEKSFLDGETREIEISALEHEPVGEKTTMEPEKITKQDFEESQSETNKEMEPKLDAKNQVDGREDRNEMKDEVVLTEKVSSELGQPMEQNVEEIQACQTTTIGEKTGEVIAEKNEELSLGSIEDTNDDTIKEEKSFLDERTREIEICALEHELVDEKTTMEPEEITKQDFEEIQSERNKEQEAKLDTENQANNRSEVKDEISMTEKMSSELGQLEQNVDEIQECQTTTMSEKIEDEIAEKDEDLSHGSIEDTNDNTVKEEKNFLDGRTREIEIFALEHEPVGEKTTTEPKEITNLIFQESKSETNKDMEPIDAENQDGERENGSEMKDEVVLTEKMSSELEKPMEQNVEEIQACRTTTMSEKIEDEIVEKDDNTIKEEKSFLDGKTWEIETSTLENEPVGEKTTLKPEEITKTDFQESQTETNKEIEGKLDTENRADGTADRSDMKDEIILTEKMSSELEQPKEQNVEEIQACRTITMSEKIEDEIAEKDEDLSLGNKKNMDDDTTKEEKTFLDGRTREIEISTLEHESIGEKTTMEPKKITKQDFEESQSETNKELEPKLDAVNQADGREDRSEMKDEVVFTEKMSSELGQPMEQNVEEILACQTTTMSEKTEEEIAEKDEDLSHGSIEDTNDDTTKEEKSFLDGRTREIVISTLEHEHVEEKNGGLDEISKKKCIDLNEATSVELQEDFIPSRSPGTSTEDTPNSENSKAESENLPIEDLDSVSEVQIPRMVPTSEDSNLKEECLISATATSIDEERETVTKEISNDEIAYSDPIPVENPEVTEVRVDAQIGQEDLQAAEDINCESKTSSSIQALKKDLKEGAEKSTRISGEVKHDGVDEAPKQERISTLEDTATLEPQVDQSNIKSTYPSECDKSPTQALESVIDVQTPEVVADSEESKVKEECVVLATAEHTDENNGEEEQEIKTNEISSAETAESKQVVEHPSMTCPDAVLIEENLKLYGELKPTSELMIDEDQVNETKPQPEQSNITSENIMKYQTLESKLEQTSEKDLNRSRDMKEDVTLEPENQINSTEDQNETIKNVIFKENVVVETEKEEGKTEVKEQDSEKDNCPKELEKTSTSNQKELANEIEYSESIPTENTEVAEVKAESQREEAPNHEFEKEEKNDGLISEIPTPEAILEMETKEEHLEATNNSCETLTGGLSSEKLLGELKEIDAKEDTEIIVRGEEKAAEDSYQDAVAEVTAISQKEEKLVSMVPHEELTSPTAEDQTNELATETDNTKVEYNNISKKDRNPEEFTETLTEDQRSVKEKHIEKEEQGNFGVENMEAKSGNEAMEDVLVNEVLLEVEKAKECKSIKDNINKEASCVPNQLASATDEVCQIKRLNSSPNELLEAKDSVEDIGDPNLTPENLNLKAEKIIEADANKEKETLNEQIDDPAKTTSDSISSSTEQDKEVRSEKSSGHGDMHKLEEKPTEVCELTSEVDETVAEGKEVSTLLTENLPEASPEMLLVKHDLETTTIQDVDKRFEEAPAIDDQKHENDLNYTAVDETVAEGKEVSTMLTVNLPEASPEMLLVKHDLETTTMQDVDKRFEEAPAVDDQKHENDLDYTAKARTIDVVSKTESPEIEQQHLDKKEASVGPINQENQSDQKKEADEKIQSDIPIEKMPKQTTAHKEIADEFLVMPVAKEEEKLNCLQDYSKEEEHSAKWTYQDPEAVTEPSQTDKLSDKVKKAEPIDIQEETMAEGNLHEEETEKRTNITEATVEKGDATLEYVKSSDVDLKGDMDAPVPKCVSTRNPEVKSAILEVLSGMDATAVKAGYNKDPNDKTSEAHVAEKGVLKEDIHHDFGTNQEPFNLPLTKEGSMELDAPVMPGTAATEDVEISQKYVTDDLIKTSQIQPEQQKNEVSACDVNKQLPDKPYQNESMESKLLTGNIDGSHEQGEPTAKSLNANTKDLKPTIASSTEPQCSSEVVKEEKKISDEKEKSETAEPATIFNDILHESTKGNSEVAENLIDDREPAPKNDQQVDQEETGDNRAKTDEEDEAEEDDEDNEKMGSGSDALVMIEAPKDMEVKVHKKSHNILSGVGSKVKHSIAKVKKAITGKSSHPKPPSPKEEIK